MNIQEEYEQYREKVGRELAHVKNLLSEELPDEPEALIKSLSKVEAWNARVLYYLAEANTLLDRAEFILKPSKEEGTAYDRGIELASTVSPFRGFRDKIEGLVEAIKQRLILGESQLSYMKQQYSSRQ